MSEPWLVIFDCDGVLVDSMSIACDLLACSLTEVGLPTTPQAARTDYGELLLSDVVARAEARIGRELPRGWLEDYESARAQAFRDKLEPIRGAAGAVEAVIDAGAAVCVASQGSLEKTRLTLELTKLDLLFASGAVFSAYEVRHGKPHPDLLLHASRMMKVPPSRCLVIEDSSSGVMAAVSARMRVLGYAADADQYALRRAGARTFESFEELPRLLALA